MSETCCTPSRPLAQAGRCPLNGFPGRSVDWLTVAALGAGPVPPRQGFWLCRDPQCDVVYFGSGGALLGRCDLRTSPGFKGSGAGLLCYCFEVRRSDLAREIAERGETEIPDRIRAEVKAGNCACEVRNPSGRCCLGDLRRAVREIEAQTTKAAP